MEAPLLANKPTLVRRVSDLLKDGSQSTPLLFNNPSIQKLRHCCQNLNLFPYLLYSLGSKTSTEKFTLTQLIQRITDKIFLLYASVYASIRQRAHRAHSHNPQAAREKSPSKLSEEYFQQHSARPSAKKPHSLLIYAIYVSQVVLVTQLVTLLRIMFIGKFTPGFIFLFSAMLLLCCISMKVFFASNISQKVNRGKRKIE
ncbi:uncharacterized protein LOC123269934 [Cotesia glomerata]|nr:uncharacterized protein LOC123269934 [Cotesia glomerata]